MYKVLVCDDEIEVVGAITEQLNRYVGLYDMEVLGFCAGDKLYNYCLCNDFDIIYMDIEIGSDNGLKLAKSLKLLNPDALIIYISSHDNYYISMVQAEPFRFIHKEAIDIAKFEKEVADTLELAINRLRRKKLWSFTYERKQYAVDLWKIEYFYSRARKIYIVGEIGDIPNCFYGKMDDLQKELDSINRNFVRIRKSYIINMRYIRWTKVTKIMMKDKVLNLSLDYCDEFIERYAEYRSGNI